LEAGGPPAAPRASRKGEACTSSYRSPPGAGAGAGSLHPLCWTPQHAGRRTGSSLSLRCRL